MPRKTFIQISSHMSNIVNVSFIRECICFYLNNNIIMFIILLKTRDIKKHLLLSTRSRRIYQDVKLFAVYVAHHFCSRCYSCALCSLTTGTFVGP